MSTTKKSFTAGRRVGEEWEHDGRTFRGVDRGEGRVGFILVTTAVRLKDMKEGETTRINGHVVERLVTPHPASDGVGAWRVDGQIQPGIGPADRAVNGASVGYHG